MGREWIFDKLEASGVRGRRNGEGGVSDEMAVEDEDENGIGCQAVHLSMSPAMSEAKYAAPKCLSAIVGA